MKMRRLFCSALAAILLLCLAACSVGQTPQSGAAAGTASSAVASVAVEGTVDEEYQAFVDNFSAIIQDVGAAYPSYDDFYGLLLEAQARGDIPYVDRLVAGGEVSEPFSLTIGGKAFTNAEAEGLTVYTASYHLFTKVEGHDVVWVGYRFTEVCERLGIELHETIRLTADDGYSQPFDVKNIDDNTMIALSRDGSSADAPYFAPCSMLVNANYTKYLTEIEVE